MARTNAVIFVFMFLISLDRSVACPDPNRTFLSLESLLLNKRFISLGNADLQAGETPIHNAWPQMALNDQSVPPGLDLTAPGAKYQPVRYCYKDPYSVENLRPIVDKAIQKWSRAFATSALVIVPDVPKPGLLCSEKGVRDDALVISDATLEGRGKALTILGYLSESIRQLVPDYELKGRHQMIIGRLLTPDVTDPAYNGPDPEDVGTVTHELGHTLGLIHEHQRPDSDQHIWFYCENLAQYQDFKRWVMYNTPGYSIDQACADTILAVRAGFQAFDFSTWKPQFSALGVAVWSPNTYDIDSVMHYSSFTACKSFESLQDAVLLRHDPDATEYDRDTKNGYEIFRGGQLDQANLQISEGDIARVAQLYPAADSDQAAKAVRENPKWSPTSQPNPLPKRTAMPVA